MTMPVLLITDVLIFLLLAGVAGYFVFVSRHPQMRATWMRVTESPSGMAALVVLLAYLGVGLLDSVHYRPPLEAKDPKAARFSRWRPPSGHKGRGEK